MTKKAKNKKNSNEGVKGEEQREKISEVDKEWFTIQIKSLEEKLEKRVQKINTLEISNKDLEEKYLQLREDKADVVAYLKRTLNQRTDQITELQARLEGLQIVHATDADKYEGKIKESEQEFTRSKQQMESDNMVLTKKLDALEEFRIQREQLMNRFEEQNKKMEKQKTIYEDQMYKIERGHILEQDRLKKDMMSRLENIAAEFRNASHAQMAATTQRTIRENVNLSAQVLQLSDRVSDLTKTNESLEKSLWDRDQEIQLLNKEKDKLIKRNTYRLKVIDDLTKKCKAQKVQLEKLNSFYGERRQYESQLASNALEIEKLKQELVSITSALEKQGESVHKMKSTLNGVSKKKESVNRCLSQANESIKYALALSATESEENDKFVRERVLNQLLGLLNKAIKEDSKVKEEDEELSIEYRDDGSSKVNEDIDYVEGSLGLVPAECSDA